MRWNCLKINLPNILASNVLCVCLLTWDKLRDWLFLQNNKQYFFKTAQQSLNQIHCRDCCRSMSSEWNFYGALKRESGGKKRQPFTILRKVLYMEVKFRGSYSVFFPWVSKKTRVLLLRHYALWFVFLNLSSLSRPIRSNTKTFSRAFCLRVPIVRVKIGSLAFVSFVTGQSNDLSLGIRHSIESRSFVKSRNVFQ